LSRVGPTMHRLTLLGRVSIQRSSGVADGAASRPRPLALLALLAAAGRMGLARDKCLVFLWPESDTQRARNSLHQTLYSIRGDLGQDAVLTGAQISLNPEQVSVDLWDFEAALDRGDPAAALSFHAGPFLDGFGIDGLPEFEEWISAERRRIERRYGTALERAAQQASAAGDHGAAVNLRVTRVQLEPLSAPPTVALMHALVAAGDRASALACGQKYVDLVRRELNSDADPSVLNLMASLRAPTPAMMPGVHPSVPIAGTAPAMGRVEPAAGTGVPHTARRATRRPRSRAATYGSIALVTALAAAAVFRWSRASTPLPGEPESVAVFPFTVSGDNELQYLSRGVVDLLTTSLDGAGSLRGVDPRVLFAALEARRLTTPGLTDAGAIAGRLQASRFVMGSVAGARGRVRLLAALYARSDPDSAIATAVTEGEASDLFRLVDDLASQLLAGSLSAPRDRLTRVAAATTSSLPALKSYLAGEDQLRAGRYADAAASFQRATQLDSGFALAYYRLTIAADWLGRDTLERAAADMAARLVGRLGDHDASLVNAAVAMQRGDLVTAERLYREIVVDYPDDMEAWLQYGELLFHQNPLRGRSATEARTAYEHVLALDPDDEESLLHLARIASLEGRTAEVDSLTRRLLRLTSSGELLELRAFRAFALGDRDSWKRVTREMRERPPDVPAVTAVDVALSLDDLDGTERFAAILTDARYSDQVRGLGYRLRARASAARGDWKGAWAALDSGQRFDAVSTLELRSLLASLDFLGVPLEEVRAIRTSIAGWDAAQADIQSHSVAHGDLHRAIRAYRLGLLSARLSDTGAILVQADSLKRMAAALQDRSAVVTRTLEHSLRARAAFAVGDLRGTLDHLEQADWIAVKSGFEGEAADRFLRAVVLDSLGRDQEALAWYRAIAQRATHELVYVAPARLRESVLAARLNERDHAISALRSADLLWRRAPQPQRDRVAEAERQVRQLGVALPGDVRQ